MESQPPTRGYRMTARAQAAARTSRGILDATAQLWRERPIGEVTLAAIAERAGVTVRTVLRRFGSREGVIAACIQSDAAGIAAERDRAPAGDVPGALHVLLAHYERDGDAVLRTLAVEATVPEARAIADAGRDGHRAWCARVFAPWLAPLHGGPHAARLDALVAATDLHAWKLLRRDLGRSAEETARVLRILVDGVLSLPPAHP